MLSAGGNIIENIQTKHCAPLVTPIKQLTCGMDVVRTVTRACGDSSSAPEKPSDCYKEYKKLVDELALLCGDQTNCVSNALGSSLIHASLDAIRKKFPPRPHPAAKPKKKI